MLLCCRYPELGTSESASIAQELRGGEDHTIINQYFDAIDKLVALVMEGHGMQAKEEGLCEAVLQLQDVSCWRRRPCGHVVLRASGWQHARSAAGTRMVAGDGLALHGMQRHETLAQGFLSAWH